MVESATSLRLICPPARGAARPARVALPERRRPSSSPTRSARAAATLRGQGVWRYRDWLPDVEPRDARRADDPARQPAVAHRRRDVQARGREPTGSFKDRGSALLAGWLTRLGVERVAEDSSGNAGASLAGYAARAGIACDIYVPATASPGKLTQIAAYGATVVPVEGVRQNAADAAAARRRRRRRVRDPPLEPALHRRDRDVGIRALGAARPATCPTSIVTPLGAGTLLLGAARASRRCAMPA